MSNDLYQRQLEKAQKRLEHSSNCLAGLTKDRNAAVLSKKARKKLYKEYSDSIVKNIASGTDVAVNRKHLEKLAEKHSKHKKDVLQGNCLSAPLLEDVLQNEETESKAENWCSWEPEALPETMPDSMLQDNCPRMEEKSANKVALPMRVPEPAIKKAPKAQSLVELAGELKKYVHIISYGNILYYHNEYYYTQLDSNQLIKLYRQNVDYELNNKSSLRGYKDLYDCLVTDPQIECSEPEDEPIYAPLENGILDLMEWKLYPHSPDQITFTCIKAKYDPQAKCQIFEEYLQRVTGGDFLLSKRVWMAIGYLLIYPARGKFFIFMKGIGNSGKSVLGSFIRRLYPKESISSIRLKQMKNEFGMASLANPVINFDMDMPSSKIDEEAASRLKQITGGDSINVPRKFRDDALLERRIKFVFSSNHPLIIDGEDDALLKRIIYLPFNYAIPDDQQDPYLGEKIWKERDAIVTKALRYARKLVQLNYIFPEIPQVDNVKCIVRDSIAKTVGKFIQESCDRSEPKAVTATEDLYNAYSDYCKEKNMWACSKKAFTQELTQRGIKHTRFRCIGEDMIARKNPVSAFKGIRLRP